MNKFLLLILSLIMIAPMGLSASSDDWSEGMDDSRMRSMMTNGAQSGMTRPVSSGSMMEAEMKGLHMAMMQLTPADHAALVTMIRDYLKSKNIDPAIYAEKREEMKQVRKDTREEIQTERKKLQESAKAKREEMRTKVQSLRGTGKVNVQDMSMTRSTEMGGGKVNVQDISMMK